MAYGRAERPASGSGHDKERGSDTPPVPQKGEASYRTRKRVARVARGLCADDEDDDDDDANEESQVSQGGHRHRDWQSDWAPAKHHNIGACGTLDLVANNTNPQRSRRGI